MIGIRMLSAMGLVWLASGPGLAAGAGEPFPPMEGRTNLASGKAVAFSPRPNYDFTAGGDSDATDLTDGKTVERADNALWRDARAVGWSYPGRVNLALDLGADCEIDEIAIRLQNGGMKGGGIHFPGWVEAFVGDDGEHFVKVAEFSRWNPGEFQKFGISREGGRSYVDCPRFKDLKARGRFVGLRLYGNDVMASDELYVFGKPADAASTPAAKAEPGDFTASHPQFYFHKPFLELATNIPLPVPIGLTTPPDAPGDARVTLTLDLPPGLEIVGGNVGRASVAEAGRQPADEPGWTRLVFEDVAAAPGADPNGGKDVGRLYPRATGWSDGQTGELRFRFSDGTWSSGSTRVPVRAVKVVEAPRLKSIMATLGWWDATRMGWPDQLAAFRTLGINTFNVFSTWMPKDPGDPRWTMLEEARKQGFFISNIDSPIHKMMSSHPKEREFLDQFADGKTGDNLCVSYRGRFYREEIARFAGELAAVRPDFSSVDIELWSWSGPVDAEKCSRCQADFAKSGLKSWADWRKAKGLEIVADLMTAAQAAVKQAGGQPFRSGSYDFRPGQTYQAVYEFDAMYPRLLQHGEVSTYTSLQDADLALIGDQAREDRARLPRSDLMPWNTPGDAGTFPGEAFVWSLLENYANGARGVWFWSSRMWDSEDLIAYNKVIRALAPVEDVIVDGELIGGAAEVVGPGRVSGVKRDGRMLLLAADYLGETDGSIKLRLTSPGESILKDLFTGEDLNVPISAGAQTVTIPLLGHRGRLLELRPR